MAQRIRPNARFWVWFRGGWVKLTLRPGECRETVEGGRHDEGWGREVTSYEHDGDCVRCEWAEDGADCDGRYSRGGAVVCPLDQLRSIEPAHGDADGLLVPDWQSAATWQRDHAAEAAGY
jgi:hypothetical protein